ncbi:LuxR C-terminal-related transcriptional regulator [Streptomyces hydrogenans]|uniref:helix-turn-helix transcriptional regulator n=1 Tax=Streptomyces hydrogenans TaxID=1873719 RepID=UPI0036739F6F
MNTRRTPAPPPLAPERLAVIRKAAKRGIAGPAGTALQELLAEIDRMRPVMPRSDVPCPLSPTELDIVIGLARGETREQTAARRGVSLDTIRTHRLRIHRRLGVHRAAHVAAIAMAHGWVTSADVLEKRS